MAALSCSTLSRCWIGRAVRPASAKHAARPGRRCSSRTPGSSLRDQVLQVPTRSSARGDRQVAEVELVEVDVVGAEPAQRSPPGCAGRSRGGVLAARACRVASSMGLPNLVAMTTSVPAAGERPAEDPLAVPGAVVAGGVEERRRRGRGPGGRRAPTRRRPPRPSRAVGRWRPRRAADRPAAHAEGADLDAAAAEGAGVRVVCVFVSMTMGDVRSWSEHQRKPRSPARSRTPDPGLEAADAAVLLDT